LGENSKTEFDYIDPSQPIDPNFSIPPASQVKCMIIGFNGLQVDLTTIFGPDNQPYFGGQRTVNTFNADPGGSSPTAWPQCICANRTYLSGGSGFTTGVGVADDLKSLMAFTDSSGLGLAGQELIIKAPLCEDM